MQTMNLNGEIAATFFENFTESLSRIFSGEKMDNQNHLQQKGSENRLTLIAILLLLTTVTAMANWQHQIVPADTQRAIQYADSAKSLEEKSEYNKSSALFAEAATIYHALQRWESYIDCLISMADNSISTGEFAVSDSLVDIALPMARRLLETPNATLARTYTIAGSLADELAHFRLAIAYYDTAYTEYVALYGPEHLRVGVVRNNRSLDYRKLGEYDKALEDQEAAGEIFKKALGEEHFYLGVVYSNIGNIYSEKNQYEKALAFQEKGLAIKLKHLPENHPQIGDSYGNISAVYIQKGDYAKALEFEQRSLAIDLETRGAEHPATAINYNNIGIIYSFMAQYDEALQNHLQALDIRRKVFESPHRSLSQSYHNLGLTYRALKDQENALKYFQDALVINRELIGEESGLVGGSYYDIGLAYAQSGDYREALDYYRRCIRTVEAISGKHTRMAGLAHTGIADIYSIQGDYERAIRHYQRSFSGFTLSFADTTLTSSPLPEDILIPNELINSIAGKAQVLAKRAEKNSQRISDLQLSLKTYMDALELADQVRLSYRAEDSKLLLVEKLRKIHEDAITVALNLYEKTSDQQFASDAFVISQMSKATVLSEALQKSGALSFSGIPDRLIEQEQLLRREMVSLEASLAGERQKILEGITSPIEAILQKALFIKRQEYQTFLSGLEKTYPQYYQIRYQNRQITPAELIDALPEGTLVLDYFLTNQVLYGFALTSGGFGVREIPLPATFGDNIRSFHQAIKTVDSGEYFRTGELLYKHLISPFFDDINKVDKLVFLPDGLLHYLPFEALPLVSSEKSSEAPVDYSRADYLIRHAEISYHYSADLLMQRIAGAMAEGSNTFVGFAPAFLDNQNQNLAQNQYSLALLNDSATSDWRSIAVDGKVFGALPNSLEEVTTIAKLFKSGGSEAKLFLNNQASEKSLKTAAADAGFLHIANAWFSQRE